MASKTTTELFLALLLSTLLIYPLPPAKSQEHYTEEVTVTIMGSSAYWEISMKGAGFSVPWQEEIEREKDSLFSYQIFTIDASRWSPEFELFSNSGYNLLGFDAIPSSGIFLKVKSDNFESATRLAASLSLFLHLSYTYFSSNEGFYIFYSHMDFNMVKEMLWNAVPIEYEGVARLLSKDVFTLQEVPIFKVSGENVNGDIVHMVTLAGLKSNILSSQKEFKLTEILNTIGDTTASSKASSSTITIKVIGGFVSYSEEGTVKNFSENRTATVITTVEAGQTFPDLSIDLVQTFPSLIAIRDVDRVSLEMGDIVTVGIRVRNVGPPGSIPAKDVNVVEDWWMNLDEFEFLDGESTRTLGHLAAGAEFTLAYRLKLISSHKGEVVTPPSIVLYSYDFEGENINELANINQLTIILNDVRPSLFVEATVESSASPILSSAPVTLTINNKGKGHATNLEVEGNFRQSLLSGDIWVLTVNQSSNSLNELIKSKVWSVSWDEGGERKEALSNSITLHYNLTGTFIPQFEVQRNIVHTFKDGENLVNGTVTIINKGIIPLDLVILSEDIPEEFLLLGGNYSLRNHTLFAEDSNIGAGKRISYFYYATILNDENYVIQPTEVIIVSVGFNITRLAKSVVLPLGVNVLKNFEFTDSFVGANITVDGRVVNKGSLPIFDVSFNFGEDSFIKVIEGKFSHTSEVLNKDEHLGSEVMVMLSSAGQFEVSKGSSSFTLAGAKITKYSELSFLDIYPPISVEMLINPSIPIENEEFTISLTIKNPSSVPVQDVRVNFELPLGIKVTEGSLQLSVKELEADALVIKNACLVSNSPMSRSIGPSLIQFKYKGDTFKGTSKSLELLIDDNMQNRYGIPIFIAAIFILITVYIARRYTIPKKI